MTPITFRPLFMERVWGGRRIAEELGKALPPDVPIGESWEIVDRKEEQSIVDSGPFEGKSLHELWTKHRREIFGTEKGGRRFPLLAKILDAREKLSVQVHPPAHLAEELHGDPKTEMWYLLGAEPGAELFVGFRQGVTRDSFEDALASGHAAELLHRLPVREGDAIFIPSGRCHAIGAGCLIVEMQQNSDTTYRVFDWNRVGLDGQPRQLHVRQSLQAIDFNDHEPALESAKGECLVDCEHFRVERWDLAGPRADTTRGAAIFTVLAGEISCPERTFHRGDFFLLPAGAKEREVRPQGRAARVLRTTLP